MIEVINFINTTLPMFSKSGTLIAQISKSIFDRQHYFQVKLIIILGPLFMDVENASGPVDTEL